jgi:type I restriction enzyme S subunit
MSSEWCAVSISELASAQPGSMAVGPFGSRMKADLYVPSGVRVIRGNNLSGGREPEGEYVHVSEETADSLASCCLKPGDLVFPHRGNIGEVGITPDDGLRYILSTSLMKLSPDREKVDPLYLMYFFKSSIGRAALLMNASQVGTPGIATPLKSLRGIKLPLPPLSAQCGIAEILSLLDDRITLLRETNATVEAIAQALFKSWFVDFDPVRAKQAGRTPEGMDADTAALFPDSFEESKLGLVPKGWKIGVLQDCCARVESGGTPKRTVADYWNGNVSWLTSGEVRNPIVFDTKEKITELGVKESSAKIWPQGTTIVAMYGATAGEVCLLAKPTTANQACCGLIPRDRFRSFLFFCVRRERENLASKSSGSAQQNLNKGLVSGHSMLIPSEKTVTAYENIVGVLLDGWIGNEQQAQMLSTLRDTLLPRLISGQLRLPEAEAMLEESAA